MGRYDGPHFEVEDELVSVWAAKNSPYDVPGDYFEENYEGEDDEPFNQFSSDFGFGYYDHDFIEPMALDGCDPIEKIIEAASYGKSYSGAVKQVSDIEKTEHVFLMYNFKYDPRVTGVTESKYYKFIGVFEYDSNT